MPASRFDQPCATDHYTDGHVPDEEHLLATLGDVVRCLETSDTDHLLMGGIGSFAMAHTRSDPSLNAAAFNCKMTDLQGALGVAQLNQLGTFLDQRAAPFARASLPLPALER